MTSTPLLSSLHLPEDIPGLSLSLKQALAQAIMLKRQKIIADSMQALDDKTNEMLKKNAQNSVAQS